MISFGFFSKCWDAGYVRLIGRVYGLILLILTLSTYLAVKGDEVNIYTMVGLLVIGFIVILIAGFFYLKLGLWKAEQRSMFKESPDWVEMKEDIKFIKNKLEQDESK